MGLGLRVPAEIEAGRNGDFNAEDTEGTEKRRDREIKGV